jgi:AAA domain, putative AbiEii toxin, Type IV TA system
LGRTIEQGEGRLVVARSQTLVLPTLDALSAGQSLLLGIFATVLKYGTSDHTSRPANEVEGIVLVDEIDAHLHADLQHDVLPALIEMFPRVQFIVSSHSPLFALGMEKRFGPDGFTMIEMPSGLTIDAERFSEFERSFAYYRDTQRFDAELQQKLRDSSRPLVLCEGETDPRYLKAAARALGMDDLADNVDFDWVGRKTGPNSSEGAGSGNLDRAEKFLRDNPNILARRTILLYDCDENAQPSENGNLIVRGLPRNEANTKCESGIENLLPEDLLTEDFYRTTQKRKGATCTTIRSLRKNFLCDWVCTEKADVKTFEFFRGPLTEIRRVLLSNTADLIDISKVAPESNIVSFPMPLGEGAT